MNTELVDEPGFAGQSDALLARLASGEESGAGLDDYQALLAARAEPPDPELAGVPDPAVEIAELYLPARGGPVRARLYRAPGGRPAPLLLWLHGGGFVGGTVTDLDATCSGLARRAGATVISLEYRLAPEHPFPAALHDTYDAMRWLAAHGGFLGGDGRVAAGGQSAGAALVAGACLLARDGGDRDLIAAQVLCYPVLDFDQDTESAREFDGVFLSLRPGQWAPAQYLGGLPATGYAAPLRAGSLEGLPPALVIGAGRDPLRDDARGYAARLAADGVPVRHVEYAGTMHAFLNFPGALAAGGHAVELIAAHLRRELAGDRQPS